MQAAQKSPVSDFFYKQGIITYLLFFIPIIPGFVELHTKAYLAILDLMKTEVHSSEEAIGLVFGERGIRVYRDYMNKHHALILPKDVFESIYLHRDLSKGLKLISRVLFDKKQRNYEYSDSIRAIIYTEIPHIIEAFPEKSHTKFRTQLIQKMVSGAHIDHAIPSRLAAITAGYTLLHWTSMVGVRRKEIRRNAEFDLLSAKIKAELAGTSSIYSTSNLSPTVLSELPDYLLTQEAVVALKQLLRHLTKSTAPEIRELAAEKLKMSDELELRRIYDLPQYHPQRNKHESVEYLYTV